MSDLDNSMPTRHIILSLHFDLLTCRQNIVTDSEFLLVKRLHHLYLQNSVSSADRIFITSAPSSEFTGSINMGVRWFYRDGFLCTSYVYTRFLCVISHNDEPGSSVCCDLCDVYIWSCVTNHNSHGRIAKNALHLNALEHPRILCLGEICVNTLVLRRPW